MLINKLLIFMAQKEKNLTLFVELTSEFLFLILVVFFILFLYIQPCWIRERNVPSVREEQGMVTGIEHPVDRAVMYARRFRSTYSVSCHSSHTGYNYQNNVEIVSHLVYFELIRSYSVRSRKKVFQLNFLLYFSFSSACNKSEV